MTKPRAIDLLAAHLSGVERAEIPDRVIERATDCVLDVVGAAAVGINARSTRVVREVALKTLAPGSTRIWFDGHRTSTVAAAFANAMAATAMDVDDGHRLAAGHPGVAVISAALPIAEQTGACVDEMLVAVVLGYETAVRVALARHLENHKSTVSGRWSGVGAAVAAARLRRLSTDQMAQAILIAEQQSPRLSSAMLHGFAGSHVKEGIAWSVLTGVMAADLAAKGFTGYPDTFEQDVLYDPVKLAANLEHYQAIDGLFFKPYACCRWIHAALDGVRDILDETALLHNAITRIEIHTFDRAVGLGNAVAPQTEEEAQFSIPFCVGALAAAGARSLMPLNATLLSHPDVLAVAQRTRVVRHREMQEMFPAKAAAIVRIFHGDGIEERRVESSFGDPTNPMSRSDLQQKFRTLTQNTLDKSRSDAIVALFGNLTASGNRTARDVLDILAG